MFLLRFRLSSYFLFIPNIFILLSSKTFKYVSFTLIIHSLLAVQYQFLTGWISVKVTSSSVIFYIEFFFKWFYHTSKYLHRLANRYNLSINQLNLNYYLNNLNKPLTCSTCATNPMDMSVDVSSDVIVDDCSYLGDVQTTRWKCSSVFFSNSFFIC